MPNAFLVTSRGKQSLFAGVPQKQIPFALALGLNKIAAHVKSEEARTMRAVFDRPTPYTMNSLQTIAATKQRPVAFVYFKDKSGSFVGDEASVAQITASIIPGRRHYLLPQVFGGSRAIKAFEARLRKAGAMGPGQYAIPGRGAKLDSYGNMSRGQIVQILAYFGGFGEVGGVKNTTPEGKAKLKAGTKGRRGVEYFALQKAHGGLKPGVYKRTFTSFGAGIEQVLFFIDRPPNYRKLFDFYGVAQRTAAKVSSAYLLDAISTALATAKK